VITGRRRGLLAIALLAVSVASVLAVAAGTAPAGNRDPVSALAATPGPAQVTYGQGVALTATLENSQKSTFTDVRFLLPLPSGTSLRSSTCASQTVSGGQLTCYWGHQLRARKTATVVVVLGTPASGPSPLNLTGKWTIKEGLQDAGAPDTFPTNSVAVSLLSASDPNMAGGFTSTSCVGSSGAPTIATPVVTPLGGPGGPLSTAVCAQNLPTAPVTGIAASIVERAGTTGEPGVSQVSDICLPAPGASCAGTPFSFSPRATFTFVVDNVSLPKVCVSGATYHGGGGTTCSLRLVTKVFHTTEAGVWQQVPKCSGGTPPDPCYTSIAFNSWKKVTTITVTASENGQWRFG
jgi:hypothetical protein